MPSSTKVASKRLIRTKVNKTKKSILKKPLANEEQVDDQIVVSKTRRSLVKFVLPGDTSDDLELTNLASDGEDDYDDKRHSALLSTINKLTSGQKRKYASTRHESSAEISELHLTASKQKVNLSELIDAVSDSSGKLKKLAKLHAKKKLLAVPLNKPEQDHVQRKVFYDDVSKEVGKWDAAVDANRNAEQLVFPLHEPSLRLENTSEVVKSRYETRNEMEEEVDKMLKSSKNYLSDEKMLTEAEEQYLKAMGAEEAKARHKELQRMRALLSHQEAKFKRQKKIKSKKYHRLLKKDRLRKDVKDFEQLKEDNPQAALEKLQEFDKIRALERASLRHKNTGKWAKHNQLRSKYDDNARDALSEQCELSKQLTQRNVIESEDEDEELLEDEEDEDGDDDKKKEPNEEEDLVFPTGFNPWMLSQKQLLENILKEREDADENGELSGQNKLVEGDDQDDNVVVNIDQQPAKQAKEPTAREIKLTYFKSQDSDNEGDDRPDEDLSASELKQRQLIAEAFADDDVVQEFKEEKEATEEVEKKKDISLFLPGWGSWGGPSIVDNPKKRDKYTIKAKNKKRKDANMGNVIISEKKSETISKYMVSELPFPFKNVQQFENSIRHPIGSTWNPEVAVRSLTQPDVVIKAGKIIEPMDQESLVKKVHKKVVKKSLKRSNLHL